MNVLVDKDESRCETTQKISHACALKRYSRENLERHLPLMKATEMEDVEVAFKGPEPWNRQLQWANCRAAGREVVYW
jgi:hypothetical protein